MLIDLEQPQVSYFFYLEVVLLLYACLHVCRADSSGVIARACCSAECTVWTFENWCGHRAVAFLARLPYVQCSIKKLQKMCSRLCGMTVL